MEEKKHGGVRPGSGRPRLKSPEDSKIRPTHQIRAYEEEYMMIKRFMYACRKNPDACMKMLDLLESAMPGTIRRDQQLTNA